MSLSAPGLCVDSCRFRLLVEKLAGRAASRGHALHFPLLLTGEIRP